MKLKSLFVLLAALGISAGVAASAVAPSVTGTVTQIIPSGTDSRVIVNGHTYTVTSQTQSAGAPGTLQSGQKVTFYLSSDGRTVIMTQAADTHSTHP